MEQDFYHKQWNGRRREGGGGQEGTNSFTTASIIPDNVNNLFQKIRFF